MNNGYMLIFLMLFSVSCVGAGSIVDKAAAQILTPKTKVTEIEYVEVFNAASEKVYESGRHALKHCKLKIKKEKSAVGKKIEDVKIDLLRCLKNNGYMLEEVFVFKH